MNDIRQYISQYREYKYGVLTIIERQGVYQVLNRYGVAIARGTLEECIAYAQQMSRMLADRG